MRDLAGTVTDGQRRAALAALAVPKRPLRKTYPTVEVGQTWAKAGVEPKTVVVFEVDAYCAGLRRVDTGRRSHMAIDRLQRRFHLVEVSDAA
jgi:hypothetical protein